MSIVFSLHVEYECFIHSGKVVMRMCKSAVVFGEVLFDVFPDRRLLGGAPLNVAYNLRNLFPIRPVLVSAVGNDAEGDEALALMSRYGLDTSCVTRSSFPTGTVSVTMNGADHVFAISPDAAWDDIRLPECGGTADMIYFGTLAQRSAGNRAVLKRILEHNAGAFVVCDINLRGSHYTGDVLDTSFAAVDFLKLSLDELSTVAALFQLPDTLSGFCGALMNAYQRLSRVAVTGGSAGAWLYNRSGNLLHQPAPPVAVIDTVGCGDAFTAMLAGSLLSGVDDAAALREAVHYASRVAGVRGALIGAD